MLATENHLLNVYERYLAAPADLWSGADEQAGDLHFLRENLKGRQMLANDRRRAEWERWVSLRGQ
jgi:hypothetical protein